MSERDRDYYSRGSSSRSDVGHYKPRDRRRSPDRRRYDDRRRENRRSRSRSRESRGDHYRRDRSRDRSQSPNNVDVPDAPPPPRITKISIGFSKPTTKPMPVKLNIASGKSATQVSESTSKASSYSTSKKMSVASVFNEDSDDEPEEMPAEAKMRMRNIGRDTPTSAGPNSFGKTKQGFCDSAKLFEKNMKKAMDAVTETPKLQTKFPQTIYKINSNSS